MKGRRFPCGPPERPRRVWECWSTRDDVDGLERWAGLSGPGYRGLLVFAYHVLPSVDLPDDMDDLWTLARPALPDAGRAVGRLPPAHARPQPASGTR